MEKVKISLGKEGRREFKMELMMILSGVVLIAVGIEGLVRTIGCYSKVDVVWFLVYLLLAAICLVSGMILCYQARKVADLGGNRQE